MNDPQIRKAFKAQFLKRYIEDNDTLVIDEFALGLGSARIDIGIINGTLNGFEIKSDNDTLKRLQNQRNVYNSIFDYVTLIVGYKHAFNAFKIIPEWWGVKLSHIDKKGIVHISNARSKKKNPSNDILSITKLLWRNEALGILEEIGFSSGFRSKTRDRICEHLVKVADRRYIHQKVCEKLKLRENWRSDLPRNSNDD